MRLILYTGLVLCAGGVLCGCGQTAAQKRAESISAEAHAALPAPRVAARLLSTVSTPDGFKQDARCAGGPGQDSICFSRSRSVLPNNRTVAEVISGMGAHEDPGTVGCAPAGNYAKPHLWLGACTARASLAGGYLLVTLRSLVVVNRAKETPTTRSTARVPGGSEIIVTDIGD